MTIALALLAAAFVLALLFPIVRLGWRLAKGDVEAEAGGTHGEESTPTIGSSGYSG